LQWKQHHQQHASISTSQILINKWKRSYFLGFQRREKEKKEKGKVASLLYFVLVSTD
jgi:hypothetical protein